MSPEQATGDRELDARSDLYSLACVTYEMLTGDPPHTGSTAQAVMASVLTEDPRRITSRRATVPPHVEASVHRALAKLPADRYSSAADFARALKDRTQTLALQTESPPGRRRSVGTLLPWGIAAGLAIGLVWSFLSRPSAETLPLAASILLEEGASTTGDLALSPDETLLVYAARRVGEDARLWVRDLGDGSTSHVDDAQASRVVGGVDDGEQASAYTRPFWRTRDRHGGRRSRV